MKKNQKPHTIFRVNGQVDISRYKHFGITFASRILHSPYGSFDYVNKSPTVPEIGICLDFLHHPAIDRKGDVSICVRFDPKRLGVLGNVNHQKIADIWNGSKRMKWLENHRQGRRDKVPLCSKCHFWGVPTGGIDIPLFDSIDVKKYLIST
jgi:radical SAM protein with 4Fe4S-binding SPASM domain